LKFVWKGTGSKKSDGVYIPLSPRAKIATDVSWLFQ
jgi:hypothetical protein